MERDAEPRMARERERMVEEQLVRRGVTDERVLAAMRRLPRHRFVQEALRDRAYGDHPLPIGEEQTISQPYIVGLMTSLLELTGREKILEVGTGSGYQTAVLAEMGAEVFGLEIVPELARRSQDRLTALGYGTRVHLRQGDGNRGWPEAAPFDRILAAAAAPAAPPALLEQLAPGGRMVIPIGSEPFGQVLTLIQKDAEGSVRETPVLPVAFVPLTGPKS